MNLELSLKQTLKLTPQLLQSMQVLQMSTQELADYLEDLVQTNPAAELTEPAAQNDESEELWRQMQSMADADHQNRQYLSPDREELDPLARVGTDGGLDETLALHLTRQLERSHASTLVLRSAQFLAACLDEDGYLRDDLTDLAQASRLPLSALEQGLVLLQSLDPAGVGARDLSQCLALQLQRRGETGPALEIVLHHLERLGRKQYHAIAQELGISQKEVLQAQSLIQELDPRPGAPFARRELPSYLIPDLIVTQDEEGLTVHYPDSYLPGLHLSGYYCSLQKQSSDPEVKQYLTDKIKQAQWAIQAVEQRRSTLLLRSGHCPAAGELLPSRRAPVPPAAGRRGSGALHSRVHRQPGYSGKVLTVQPGCVPPELLFLPGGRRRGHLGPPGEGPAAPAGGAGGQGPPSLRPEAV